MLNFKIFLIIHTKYNLFLFFIEKLRVNTMIYMLFFFLLWVGFDIFLEFNYNESFSGYDVIYYLYTYCEVSSYLEVLRNKFPMYSDNFDFMDSDYYLNRYNDMFITRENPGNIMYYFNETLLFFFNFFIIIVFFHIISLLKHFLEDYFDNSDIFSFFFVEIFFCSSFILFLCISCFFIIT